MAPFAAGKDLAGDLLDREIGIIIPAPEGGAEDEERPLRPHLACQFLQLLVGEAGGGDIDEILFGGMAVLPVDGSRDGA